VHVHAQQRTIDPLGIITERIFGDVAPVCDALAGSVNGATGTPWLARWQHAERAAQAAIAEVVERSTELTEPAVARAVSALPVQLVLSSSMPVRDVEWFGTPSATVVHSNRGANGIDGVIASGIGVAIATEAATVVLIGDVAFCHDQSSLTALGARQLPLTIVVVDNDGGGIFSFLPQRSSLTTERFEQLFGTPHGTDVIALARAHGLGARTVERLDDLLAAIDDRECTVVRVASNRDRNVEQHDALHAAVAAALNR
jgi:2-succinyl-5-enolpyruvyl-6-hydroxy-3-cyclohexene-1-carboxylate synthase